MTRSRIRILHLITGLGQGGAETMLHRVVSALDPDRFTSSVVGLLGPGPVGDRLKADGVPATELGWRRSLPAPTEVRRLRREVAGSGADVVMGWMYHGNLAAWAAITGRGSDSPALAWNVRHTIYRLRDEKPLTRAVILAGAALSRAPAAIVYNSECSAQRHERLGYAGGHRQILPNGVDPAVFRPDPDARAAVRRELGCAERTVLVGMVGRWHAHKGVDIFVESAARIAAAAPDARFVLAGRGLEPSNEPLAAQISSVGLEDRTHLLGQRSDVPRVMAALDLLVLPSRQEAFPNVVIEAHACGISVVGTDVGDAARLIGPFGSVVPAGDAVGLGEAAAAMLASGPDELARQGAAARRETLARYDIEQVGRRYGELFATLAQRRRSCAD